jgi:hypothetical protein
MTTTESPTESIFPSTTAAQSLLRDFLGWLAEEPRAYQDVMDAWRTSCPRLSIWEDALADDLITTEKVVGDRSAQVMVSLTPAGRRFIGRH